MATRKGGLFYLILGEKWKTVKIPMTSAPGAREPAGLIAVADQDAMMALASARNLMASGQGVHAKKVSVSHSGAARAKSPILIAPGDHVKMVTVSLIAAARAKSWIPIGRAAHVKKANASPTSESAQIPIESASSLVASMEEMLAGQGESEAKMAESRLNAQFVQR
jgi:hypothetical protein